MARFPVTVDAMLEPIMDRYLELRMEELVAMENAIPARDAETVRMLGHRLKGTGTSYGFERLTELGASMEIAGKEENMPKARELAGEIRAYLENIDVIFEEMD